MQTEDKKKNSKERTWSEKYGGVLIGAGAWIIILITALIVRCSNS